MAVGEAFDLVQKKQLVRLELGMLETAIGGVHYITPLVIPPQGPLGAVGLAWTSGWARKDDCSEYGSEHVESEDSSDYGSKYGSEYRSADGSVDGSRVR